MTASRDQCKGQLFFFRYPTGCFSPPFGALEPNAMHAGAFNQEVGGVWLNPSKGGKIFQGFSFNCVPKKTWLTTSTPNIYCQEGTSTARERTSHRASYPTNKKTKSLTLYLGIKFNKTDFLHHHQHHILHLQASNWLSVSTAFCLALFLCVCLSLI